jgi:hypothetical protein
MCAYPGARIRANSLDTQSGRLNNNSDFAQAKVVTPIFDNNLIEIIDATELASRLTVKVSWVIDHCSRAKTRDPLPVLRLGKHRRFRWNSREMNDWLDRQAGVSTKRKAGP